MSAESRLPQMPRLRAEIRSSVVGRLAAGAVGHRIVGVDSSRSDLSIDKAIQIIPAVPSPNANRRLCDSVRNLAEAGIKTSEFLRHWLKTP